jgi:hypothetical protein
MSGTANQVAIQAANTYFTTESQRIFDPAEANSFQAYFEELTIDGGTLSVNALGPDPVVREMTGAQVFSAFRAYARTKQVVPYSKDGIALSATTIMGDKSGMVARRMDQYLAGAKSFWYKPVVDLLVSNPVGMDGVSILNDSHPYAAAASTWDNKVTTTFSPSTLNTGVVAQTSLKSEAGMPLGIRPTHLMVEPTNERDAKDAIGVMRPIPVNTAGAANAGSANIAAVLGENWLKGELQLIVEPLLTTTTDWLIIDLSKPGLKPLVGGVLNKPEPIITVAGSQPHMQSDMYQYALRGHAAMMGYVPHVIYGRLG